MFSPTVFLPPNSQNLIPFWSRTTSVIPTSTCCHGPGTGGPAVNTRVPALTDFSDNQFDTKQNQFVTIKHKHLSTKLPDLTPQISFASCLFSKCVTTEEQQPPSTHSTHRSAPLTEFIKHLLCALCKTSQGICFRKPMCKINDASNAL